MGCNCGQRTKKYVKDPGDVMGGYKHLKPHQVTARLEVFKRKFCVDCKKRYHCDYALYLTCKGKK
jgi:tRNA 2-selenouridine synthase SelU